MVQATFQEISDVPVGAMVQALALSIAQAQLELDLMSTRVAEMLAGGSGSKQDDIRVSFGGERLTLMELGFTPTFYQFVDTVVEVKVSVSICREITSEQTSSSSTATLDMQRRGFLGLGGSTTTVRTTSVSARFAARFQYSTEGASTIRTRLVPVPPPPVLYDRMRELSQEQ